MISLPVLVTSTCNSSCFCNPARRNQATPPPQRTRPPLRPVRPERWGDRSLSSKKPTLLGSWTHGNILAGLISCLPILMLSKSLLPLFTPPIFQDSSPFCRFIFTFQLGQFHFSTWLSSIKYSILPVKSPFSWQPKLIFLGSLAPLFVAKHPEFCAPLTASTSSVTCFSCTALASEKHGETREIGRLVGFQYLSIFKKLLTPQWHQLWLSPSNPCGNPFIFCGRRNNVLDIYRWLTHHLRLHFYITCASTSLTPPCITYASRTNHLRLKS